MVAHEIVQIVVWPATLVVSLLILRPALLSIIGGTRPKRVKYRELELEFERAHHEAEGVLASEEKETGEEPPASRVEIDLRELARVAPGTAVQHAFHAVVSTARSLLDALGVRLEQDARTPYKAIQQALVARGLLDPARERTFEDLRVLRNKVQHAEGYEVSTHHALLYVDMAESVCRHLVSIRDGSTAA